MSNTHKQRIAQLDAKLAGMKLKQDEQSRAMDQRAEIRAAQTRFLSEMIAQAEYLQRIGKSQEVDQYIAACKYWTDVFRVNPMMTPPAPTAAQPQPVPVVIPAATSSARLSLPPPPSPAVLDRSSAILSVDKIITWTRNGDQNELANHERNLIRALSESGDFALMSQVMLMVPDLKQAMLRHDNDKLNEIRREIISLLRAAKV
jgi:hypothetical protein